MGFTRTVRRIRRYLDLDLSTHMKDGKGTGTDTGTGRESSYSKGTMPRTCKVFRIPKIRRVNAKAKAMVRVRVQLRRVRRNPPRP